MYIEREGEPQNFFLISLCHLANHYHCNCGNQTHLSQLAQPRSPSCTDQGIDIPNPGHM